MKKENLEIRKLFITLKELESDCRLGGVYRIFPHQFISNVRVFRRYFDWKLFYHLWVKVVTDPQSTFPITKSELADKGIKLIISAKHFY